MESVQLAVVGTGGKSVAVRDCHRAKTTFAQPVVLGRQEMGSRQAAALLYANPALAERDMEKLRAKM